MIRSSFLKNSREMPRSLAALHIVSIATGVDLQLPAILLFSSAISMVVFACGFWRRKPPKTPKNYTFNDSVVGGSGGIGLGLSSAGNPVVGAGQANEKKENNETAQS